MFRDKSGFQIHFNDQFAHLPVNKNDKLVYPAIISIHNESPENINSDNPIHPRTYNVDIPAEKIVWQFLNDQTADHEVAAWLVDLEWLPYKIDKHEFVDISVDFAEGKIVMEKTFDISIYDNNSPKLAHIASEELSNRIYDLIAKYENQLAKESEIILHLLTI